MKKIFSSKLVCLLISAFIILTGCSPDSNSKKVRDLKIGGSFVFNENLSYGTDWQTAIDYYGTDLDKLEVWEYSTGTSPFFQPQQTVHFSGQEWMQNLVFNSDNQLTMGIYECFIENKDDVEKIAADVYDAFGTGELTKEEYIKYLEDLSGKILSDYWVAEDGTCLCLTVIGSSNYTVAIYCRENADGVSAGCKEIGYGSSAN